MRGVRVIFYGLSLLVVKPAYVGMCVLVLVRAQPVLRVVSSLLMCTDHMCGLGLEKCARVRAGYAIQVCHDHIQTS